MRRFWIASLLLVSGCCTPTPPVLPSRYSISVPMAMGAPAPGTVWLRHDAKMEEDGNTYTIKFFAASNTQGLEPGSIYYQDIQTNRWPYKRGHIDLSLDGGETWPRRIAYGVNTDPDFRGGEFLWSPPMDYSLMSTQAVLRITNLGGAPFPSRVPSMPYDLPPGKYVTSGKFTIAAIRVAIPFAGQISYSSTPCAIRWMQSGGGESVSVYWITPETVNNWKNQRLTTFTNCVEMVEQERLVTMPSASHAAMRLVMMSESDPNLVGYSQIFSVE